MISSSYKYAKAYWYLLCFQTKILFYIHPNSCVPQLLENTFFHNFLNFPRNNNETILSYSHKIGHLLESSGFVCISNKFPRKSNLYHPNLP